MSANIEPGAHGAPQVYLIYTTFPDLDSAKQTATALLADRLIACANLLPSMVSIYRWQGAVEEALEVAAIFKTSAGRLQAAVDAIAAAHPYDTPAVLPLAVGGGAAGFLDWVDRETMI